MSRVLLADDSPHAQRMGERILRDEGFEVVSLTDGNAALARLADVDPDVILADVFLPGKSGIDLCRYVKGEPRFKHVRVVLTAGLLEPFDEEEAKRAGCDAILKKPFEASRVVGTIDPLVKEAQLARVRPSGQVAPALRAAPPTGAPPVAPALTSAQPAPAPPPIPQLPQVAVQAPQVAVQPPRAAAAPARSGSLTLLNIGEPMPIAPEPAPKPAIMPRPAEPPKAPEPGGPKLAELLSEIAAPPKPAESPAIAVAAPSAAAAVPTPSAAAVPTPSAAAVPTPSAAAVPTPSAAAVPTPSAAAVPTPSAAAVPTPSAAAVPTPSAAAVTTPGAAAVPTPSAAAVTTPGAAVLPTVGAAVLPTPGVAVAPSAASVPSPPAAPVDSERVRAAVTLALDAALPAMIQEITERVLIALGD